MNNCIYYVRFRCPVIRLILYKTKIEREREGEREKKYNYERMKNSRSLFFFLPMTFKEAVCEAEPASFRATQL